MSVLNGDKAYPDTYLKRRVSFFEIIATLSSNGILISHPDVIKFLKNILKRKYDFTREDDAWTQYVHLASWLVHLGAIMDIKGTLLEKTYLVAVQTSFGSMSKVRYIGMSWESFGIWKHGWSHLTYDNRDMIINYFKDKTESEDRNEVLNQ